jgi:hypothetical protein
LLLEELAHQPQRRPGVASALDQQVKDLALVVDGTPQIKDGKQHRYWSVVVENTRVAGGRTLQRHVLYLGEINDSQELAWRRSIEVLEDGTARPRTLSLFPEDRCEGLLADASIVGVKLSELRLRRPRQWGACWLALMLWRELQLDQFWSKRLGMSRKGTGRTLPGGSRLCANRGGCRRY